MAEHVRKQLSNGRLALLSTANAVSKAVFFVHGYGGDADGTWFDFQTLVDRVDESGWWADTDLYFFTYDSIATPIRVNVAKLNDFMGQLFPLAAADIFEVETSPMLRAIGFAERVALRDAPSVYQTAVLVAHSEGAVVVRTGILDRALLAHEELRDVRQARDAAASSGDAQVTISRDIPAATRQSNREEQVKRAYEAIVQKTAGMAVLNAELCLFAPAHCGASITGLLGALLELPGLAALLRPILRWSTAKGDLSPSSPLISGLRARTEPLSYEYPWIPALRARVLWGEQEKVVFVDNFASDSATYVADHDHTSICKPTLEYTLPLRFIEDNV